MLAAKIDQKLPQTLPRRPQDELRSYFFDLSASSPHLGTILARFCLGFGLHFGRFWVPKGRLDRQNDAKLTSQFSSILESIFKAYLSS